MAVERRGERAGHRRGRLRGLAGVALLFALLIAGCDETAPVDPGQLPGGGNNSGSTGGGGSSTDSTALGDPALVGTWVNSRVLPDDQDVTTVITTWVFAERRRRLAECRSRARSRAKSSRSARLKAGSSATQRSRSRPV